MVKQTEERGGQRYTIFGFSVDKRMPVLGLLLGLLGGGGGYTAYEQIEKDQEQTQERLDNIDQKQSELKTSLLLLVEKVENQADIMSNLTQQILLLRENSNRLTKTETQIDNNAVRIDHNQTSIRRLNDKIDLNHNGHKNGHN